MFSHNFLPYLLINKLKGSKNLVIKNQTNSDSLTNTLTLPERYNVLFASFHACTNIYKPTKISSICHLKKWDKFNILYFKIYCNLWNNLQTVIYLTPFAINWEFLVWPLIKLEKSRSTLNIYIWSKNNLLRPL